MEFSESIVNITAAVNLVMNAVKSIEKNMTIGDGKFSYKGVADKDVKYIVGQEMAKNGLAMFPIGGKPRMTVERWEEVYGNNPPKPKQSILAEVETVYLLTHTSGEWIKIWGYGHGVDSQDKSAGKATTYALKYALLYTFMVPTGHIDDADNTASKKYETPKKQPVTLAQLFIYNENTKDYTDSYKKVFAAITTGVDGKVFDIADIKKRYALTDAVETHLKQERDAFFNQATTTQP